MVEDGDPLFRGQQLAGQCRRLGYGKSRGFADQFDRCTVKIDEVQQIGNRKHALILREWRSANAAVADGRLSTSHGFVTR